MQKGEKKKKKEKSENDAFGSSACILLFSCQLEPVDISVSVPIWAPNSACQVLWTSTTAFREPTICLDPTCKTSVK